MHIYQLGKLRDNDVILKHYYIGIALGTVPFILSNHPEQKNITQVFYTNDKNVYLILDNI